VLTKIPKVCIMGVGGEAMIVFEPIMKLLSDHGWSSYRLRKEKLLSEGTISRLRRGENLNTSTIDVLCRLCECQPGDLMHYVPDGEREE